MDRRLYLAFVLAILVLVLNMVFFGSKSDPPSTESTDRETTAPPREAPEIGSMEPAPLPQERASGGLLRDRAEASGGMEPIRVETQLVSAEFDPLGGTIRSWRLSNYTDAAEEPADLVRSRNLGAVWFSLRDGERLIRTDSTSFRPTVMRENNETIVRFLAEDPSGISVEKVYRLRDDAYDCRLDVRVEGLGEAGTGSWEIGWIDGMPILEREPAGDHHAIAAVALFGKDFRKIGGGGGFGCGGPSRGVRAEVHQGTLKWMGVRNKYFLGALLLDEPADRRVHATHNGTLHTAGSILSEPLSFSGTTERSYRLYLGPIHYGKLARYGVDLERVQDLGPGVLRPFSRLLMKFFEGLNRIIPNYGIEILILSILIRVIFYPLSKKSMVSMKRMQGLKPEMDRINEKYKDDPERRNREIMELYRKKKVNPLGSCLPLLVQLPVLSGLYYVLSNAVQLRKEPFALWIRDLSAPDTIAEIGGIPVNPLPLIMAATMVWQQKITPTDPRQRTIGYLMPIMMTFFFYSMSSGLVFYWTISNLMTVLQQIWMNRTMKDEQSEAAQEEAAPAARPGPARRKGKSARGRG